jgi:glycosyltransferase involved in cell wall biosynthesis
VRDLQEADVYVLPSLAEGFGQSILEAMSCGVPVITTPNTCGPDLITEGREGFIVPIRDAEAIAAKLEWCIANRGALKEMGRAAGEAAQRLSWARFRETVRAAYCRMLIRCHEVGGGK